MTNENINHMKSSSNAWASAMTGIGNIKPASRNITLGTVILYLMYEKVWLTKKHSTVNFCSKCEYGAG